jgi:lysophospholipase L1-like esterase
LKLLATEILSYQPDVVTIYFGNWNDFVPAIGGDDEEQARRLSTPGWIRSLRGNVSELRLFMAVNEGWDRLTEQRNPRFAERVREEYIESFRRGHPPEGRRVPAERFRANLAAMIRLCRENRVAPVLISPPLSRKSQGEFPVYATYRAIVGEVARKESVPLVPAAAEMDRREDAGESVYQDWVHPNATGHKVIADLLVRQIGGILSANADGNLR